MLLDGVAFSQLDIEYFGVAFLYELLEWGCSFSGF